MKGIIIFVFSLAPLVLASQLNDTIYDITNTCKLNENLDKTHSMEVEGHIMKGPRGKYSVVKAVKSDRFLNVYCLTDDYNFLLILTSQKKGDFWEHYASFQVLFPKFDTENEVKKMEVLDIHTLYIVYETKKRGMISYVVRLVEDRYAIYQYLNDPYIDITEQSRYEFPTIEGRPKF